jgi:hypothetical protein
VPLPNNVNNYFLIEQSFLNYFDRSKLRSKKIIVDNITESEVIVKQFYKEIGLCFIVINLKRETKKKLSIKINLPKLIENRVYPLNIFFNG